MDLFVYYMVIAVITALTATFVLMYPSLKKAVDNKVVNTFTKSPWLSTTIFLVIATLVAPLFIFALFHEPTFKRITDGFNTVILEPSK